MPFEYNATLVSRVEVAPGLAIMRVLPDKLPFEFESGQYVVLGLKASEPRLEEADADETSVAAAAALEAGDPDSVIRRAYSIASGSRADEYLEVNLTLIMSGALTPRLFNLEIGGRLYLSPEAAGIFTLDEGSEKHVLMVGTGTGVAPYMSMLRSRLEPCAPPERRGVLARFGQYKGPRCFVLIQGARNSCDLAYRSELTALARRCDNFYYLPVITKPEEDGTWRGRTGYLQDVVASGVVEKETRLELSPMDFEVFLCGDPNMIKSLIAWAQERGFARDRGNHLGTLHVEEYW